LIFLRLSNYPAAKGGGKRRMESIWWKVKIYGAWLAAVIAGFLGYLHGFGLISHFIESQDGIHLAANIYLATLFFVVIAIAAYRQWISIRKERYANITPLLHQIFSPSS
jgi:hypothetical protein